MRLSDWMKARGYDDDAVAERTGFDRVTISRARRGKTKPSEALLGALYDVSGGEVTANDFFHAEAAE